MSDEYQNENNRYKNQKRRRENSSKMKPNMVIYVEKKNEEVSPFQSKKEDFNQKKNQDFRNEKFAKKKNNPQKNYYSYRNNKSFQPKRSQTRKEDIYLYSKEDLLFLFSSENKMIPIEIFEEFAKEKSICFSENVLSPENFNNKVLDPNKCFIKFEKTYGNKFIKDREEEEIPEWAQDNDENNNFEGLLNFFSFFEKKKNFILIMNLKFFIKKKKKKNLQNFKKSLKNLFSFKNYKKII